MSVPKTTPTSTMLVELDSILDTRLGVLLDIDPEKVPTILAKYYHDRLWDVFPEVDLLTYQRKYRERNTSILKNSWATPMVDLMKDFVFKTLKQTLRTPFHKLPKLDINVYPYGLSDEEAAVVISAIATTTEEQCDVQIVSYSPEDLNPVFLKNRYEVVMMYDFHTWLETHSQNGNWKKHSCPKVSVMAPLMVKNSETYDPNKTVGDILEDYETLAKTMSPYVDMQFLPLQAFCWKFNPDKALVPDTPKDTQDKDSEKVED